MEFKYSAFLTWLSILFLYAWAFVIKGLRGWTSMWGEKHIERELRGSKLAWTIQQFYVQCTRTMKKHFTSKTMQHNVIFVEMVKYWRAAALFHYCSFTILERNTKIDWDLYFRIINTQRSHNVTDPSDLNKFRTIYQLSKQSFKEKKEKFTKTPREFNF